MKKKLIKAVTVASLCVATFTALAIPCFALTSNSSIINKTCINLQSIVYTDSNGQSNYNVSGFDYNLPKSGALNNQTDIFYAYNSNNDDYYGVKNTVSYDELHANFALTPIEGENSYINNYPRVFYFGESYMPLGASYPWGDIKFNYDLNISLEDIAQEQIFISVTYEVPLYEDGQVVGFNSVTDYGTYNMTNNSRQQVVNIKSLFNSVVSQEFNIGVVHIQSLKLTRVSTVDLLPCSSVQIHDLDYYSSDGDDLSPYATYYQDYLTNNIQLRDLDIDFTTWISTAVGSFLNFELINGLSLWAVFIAVISIMFLIAFLKSFAGG